MSKDVVALAVQGLIRHQQLIAAALVPHPFTPHARDNQCDLCGREQELPNHTGRQWRLPL